jgi:thioredoxin 1
MAQVVTDQTFTDEVTNSKLPVMLDFYADWCGPCKMLLPTVEELADEYTGKVKIVKINVDDSPETAQKFEVMSIPTLVFMKDGQIVDRVVGSMSKDTLIEKLDALV